MIAIKTLESVSRRTIAQCLNLAFSDYVVPVYLSEADLSYKMKRENLTPEWSAGIFDDERLVGFMLHGQGTKQEQKVLYNGATGIAPDYRGRGFSQKIYDFLLPKMRRAGIQAVWLEVIDNNERAIKAYQKIGFSPVRELDCFRGQTPENTPGKLSSKFQIETIKAPVWENVREYLDYPPSWQNDLPAIKNDLNNSVTIVVRQGSRHAGYLIYTAYNNRVGLLAVHPLFRRQGVGTALLRSLPVGRWSLINVDRRNTAAAAFLKKMRWEKTVGQFEMKLPIL